MVVDQLRAFSIQIHIASRAVVVLHVRFRNSRLTRRFSSTLTLRPGRISKMLVCYWPGRLLLPAIHQDEDIFNSTTSLS